MRFVSTPFAVERVELLEQDVGSTTTPLPMTGTTQG